MTASLEWVERDFSDTATVPADGPDLREYILARLRLPIEVPRPDGDWGLTEGLVAVWQEIVREHQVDLEAGYIEPNLYESNDFISWNFFEEMDPTSSLYEEEGERTVALRIAGWHDRARVAFLHRTRLVRAPVAGPGEYAKHFPDASCKSVADLRARSARGRPPVSQLMFGLDRTVLEPFVLTAAAEFIPQLTEDPDKDVVRCYVDCMIDVGFVGGVSTQTLCVEWSAAMAHVYPVDADKTTGTVAYLDDLQFAVRNTP